MYTVLSPSTKTDKPCFMYCIVTPGYDQATLSTSIYERAGFISNTMHSSLGGNCEQYKQID